MNTALKILLFSLSFGALSAQPVEKIHFAKDESLIYFFQKGPAGDTILKNKSDLFYLLVPDVLKPDISILVDNGRILATGNDSLVRVEFIKGLRYESMYTLREEDQPTAKKKAPKVKRILSTFINGTAPEGRENIMVISIVNRKEEQTVFGNVFYYKP